MFCAVWYNLQLKNVKSGRLQPSTLLKLTLLHGCFSQILNCANGTKSRETSLMVLSSTKSPKIKRPVSFCQPQ